MGKNRQLLWLILYFSRVKKINYSLGNTDANVFGHLVLQADTSVRMN